MNNQPTLVQNSDFITVKGQFLMPAQTLGEKIGFKNPRKSMAKLWERNQDELEPFQGVVKMATPGGMQEVRVFDEQGCYIVAMLAKTEQAKEFRKSLALLLKKQAEQRQRAFLEVRLQRAQWELTQFLENSTLWSSENVKRFKELDGVLNNPELALVFSCSVSSVSRVRSLLRKASGDFRDHRPANLKGDEIILAESSSRNLSAEANHVD